MVEPRDDSGTVVSSGQFINLNWAQIAPGTYQTRCSTFPDNVIDETTVDQWGNGRRYQKLCSDTAVINTPGSYFVEGKNITVHPLGNRAPDSKLTVYSAQANGRYMAVGHLFVRNFEFRGVQTVRVHHHPPRPARHVRRLHLPLLPGRSRRV